MKALELCDIHPRDVIRFHKQSWSNCNFWIPLKLTKKKNQSKLHTFIFCCYHGDYVTAILLRLLNKKVLLFDFVSIFVIWKVRSYATKSNKIQQASLSVGVCLFSFWWCNKLNTVTACNILRAGVAESRGLPPVGFAWHVEGPGIETGLVCDKKINILSGFGPLPSSSLKHRIKNKAIRRHYPMYIIHK